MITADGLREARTELLRQHTFQELPPYLQTAVETAVEAINACEKLIPELHQITALAKALDRYGYTGGMASYELGRVDVLRLVRAAMGIPMPADEPKLYREG